MDRVKLTFDESVDRPCAVRFTDCGGPTASGLDGYACENWLAFVVGRFETHVVEGEQPCGYCRGGVAFAGDRGQPLCRACAEKGLDAARRWYASRSEARDLQDPPPP